MWASFTLRLDANTLSDLVLHNTNIVGHKSDCASQSHGLYL